MTTSLRHQQDLLFLCDQNSKTTIAWEAEQNMIWLEFVNRYFTLIGLIGIIRFCTKSQRTTKILNPGNFVRISFIVLWVKQWKLRSSKVVHCFSLDLEKLFSISCYRLEALYC